ncbi:unnamed protein product [Penicillium pancosmium]
MENIEVFREPFLEIACFDHDSAVNAAKGGASRIELEGPSNSIPSFLLLIARQTLSRLRFWWAVCRRHDIGDSEIPAIHPNFCNDTTTSEELSLQ